jgi:serine phosphatase RsbU (regulator of sigma subunit)
MAGIDLGAAVRAAHRADPAAVPDVVAGLAAQLDASDVVLYLVDFEQATLEPLPDRSAHSEAPHSEAVSDTMAGRAFLEEQPVIDARINGARVWVPIVEGSDRTGVLALTVTDPTPEVLRASVELGMMAGYLISVHNRSTDVYNLYRRRRSMALSASMQWDLLPPLVMKSPMVDIAGLIEPAYDVGGDCFDYAINGSTADLALFDPVGHSLHSALLAALAVGTYRHQRREGATLEQIHEGLDIAIGQQYRDLSYVSGQLARLDLMSGTLHWTNAGHPCPFLLRRGAPVRELWCPPTVPWGVGQAMSTPDKRRPTIATEALEPGDALLFFTDGATEARDPDGQALGPARLAQLMSGHASEDPRPEQLVRRLTRSVRDHRQDELTDDATFVMLCWNGRD